MKVHLSNRDGRYTVRTDPEWLRGDPTKHSIVEVPWWFMPIWRTMTWVDRKLDCKLTKISNAWWDKNP